MKVTTLRFVTASSLNGSIVLRIDTHSSPVM